MMEKGKTEEGKAISAQNSRKHGLLASSLTDYDRLAVNELLEELEEEFGDGSVATKMVIEQLVLTYLKLARCNQFQAEVINEKIHPTEKEYIPGVADKLLNSVHDDLGGKVEVKKQGFSSQITEEQFKRVELIITRYEPQLVNRMLKLINYLKS
jgi:hypothetical protein